MQYAELMNELARRSTSTNSQSDTVDQLNRNVGTLTGADCPICKNKGVIYFRDEHGYEWVKECDCMKERRSNERIKRAGLDNLVNRCTFENFEVHEEWQKEALATSKAFAANPHGWFLACGQVGAGKTHLCTAISAQLIKSGHELIYVLWRDKAAQLKAALNSEAYFTEIEPLKTADVLYLDDLWKTQNSGTVSAGDVNLAFEIINYRYIRGLITIISTEKTISELMQIDEAVASRIVEMCEGHIVQIGKSTERNRRLVAIRKGGAK